MSEELESVKTQQQQQPKYSVSGKIVLAFTCGCAARGGIDDLRTVQAVLFGNTVGVKCGQCHELVAVNLSNTLVVPVTQKQSPDNMLPNLNRRERRIIESVRGR